MKTNYVFMPKEEQKDLSNLLDELFNINDLEQLESRLESLTEEEASFISSFLADNFTASEQAALYEEGLKLLQDLSK
jgi:hypothetical protein